MKRRNSVNGSSKRFMNLKLPMISPIGMPIAAPKAKPAKIRCRLILRFAQSDPSWRSSKALRTTAAGVGKSTEGIRCVSRCQEPNSAMNPSRYVPYSRSLSIDSDFIFIGGPAKLPRGSCCALPGSAPRSQEWFDHAPRRA